MILMVIRFVERKLDDQGEPGFWTRDRFLGNVAPEHPALRKLTRMLFKTFNAERLFRSAV